MTLHKQLAQGRWFEMSLVEQFGNIGSEVGRAAKWQEKGGDIFWGAVSRALDLLDLTLIDDRWKKRRSEISRAKEVFADAVLGGQEYGSNLKDLESYFMRFAYHFARQG